MTECEWWRGAAIYQVYPRSFRDTDGDGIGDLPGITAGLEHIASLGVDALWVSPFFASPMRDFGYDVADYCQIDPMFGSMADFDALVARAHALGLKVIIDQVYAHTSDQHGWFADSRASRGAEKADWYVWADAKADGTPPNNWQSVFGGPAWTWDARRRQYYMHTFLREQPQLNVAHPPVQDALLEVARFWLDRGVDGFRLDALNHAMHDQALRDNPPAPDDGRVRTRPFDFQIRRYSQSQPGMIPFIERIRSLCDNYGAIHLVAEIGGEEPLPEMKAYTAGQTRLSSAYGFDFLYAPELTPKLVADAMADWPGAGGEDGAAEGWPSWAFENHDAPRALSRWGEPKHRDAFARLKMALFAALRGNIILYQGEELGLEQDEIPFEQLRDPEAIANWPLTLSRDGARTPLPWDDRPGGGFTTGVPWLPLGDANRARAIAVQEADPASLLHHTRHVVALRRASRTLRHGEFRLRTADAQVLAFERTMGGERIVCRFNLSDQPASAGPMEVGEAILASPGAGSEVLPPFGYDWRRLT